MAKPKQKIIDVLVKMGFEEIQLFYWPHDGWYLHCTEAKHFWIGQNVNHVIQELKKTGSKYNILRNDAGLSDYQLNELGLYIDKNTLKP